MDTETAGPEVTVVIPVFNGAEYLCQAVESVLAQTYRDFEILVVDDGSTDETWSIVEAYMAAYPGVVRGLRKTNGGIATALNAGIRAASGTYFAWLSHDDRFVPHKLEKQLNLLQVNPEAVGVYSDYAYIDAGGKCVGRALMPWYPQAEMLRHFLQTVFINGSTLVVERRCLLEVGLFDETLRYAQDAMTWVHLIMRYSLVHVPEPLTEYRLHSTQTTQTAKKRAIHRDSRTWLRRAVTDYTVQQIFPELDRPDVTGDELARAYIYFGEVFAIRYFHFKLCFEQFRRAWHAWPNMRNPVLIQSVRAMFRAFRLYFRYRKQELRLGSKSPNSPNDAPLIVDLRSWVEPVKQARFVSKA